MTKLQLLCLTLALASSTLFATASADNSASIKKTNDRGVRGARHTDGASLSDGSRRRFLMVEDNVDADKDKNKDKINQELAATTTVSPTVDATLDSEEDLLLLETTSPTSAESTGPTQPWEYCANGSSFHETAGTAAKCFSSEDCTIAGECCITSFCLCGNPRGKDEKCVPAQPN